MPPYYTKPIGICRESFQPWVTTAAGGNPHRLLNQASNPSGEPNRSIQADRVTVQSLINIRRSSAAVGFVVFSVFIAEATNLDPDRILKKSLAHPQNVGYT